MKMPLIPLFSFFLCVFADYEDVRLYDLVPRPLVDMEENVGSNMTLSYNYDDIEVTNEPIGDNVTISELNKPYRDYLFQGDLAISKEFLSRILKASRGKRQAYRDHYYPGTIWTERIPYSIHSKMPQKTRKAIEQALKFWQTETCIRFRDESNLFFTHKDYGCWSTIGRDIHMRRQVVNVGPGCAQFGIVSHEIAHALGVFHEQSRYDRDEHVDIIENSIIDGQKLNFIKIPSSFLSTYELPYDLGSIMHYSPHEFAKNRHSTTILPKKAIFSSTLGQIDGPSFKDVLLVNKHYGCLETCETPIKCENNGYQDPNDCQKCKCPPSFGGRFCHKLSKSSSNICGGTILASNSLQGFMLDFQPKRPIIKRRKCVYHLKAKQGERLRLAVKVLKASCIQGCRYSRVLIKTDFETIASGFRRGAPSRAPPQDPPIPIETLVPAWLLRHPAYHGFLPRSDVSAVLTREGAYLVRLSQVQQDGATRISFVISYHFTQKQYDDAHPRRGSSSAETLISNIAVNEVNGRFSINDKNDFASLKELIEYYSSNEGQISKGDCKFNFKLEYPAERQKWELLHEDIKQLEALGEGQFGIVWRGSLRRPSTKWVPVALKQTKNDCSASKQKRKEIMAECRLMRGLNHPNVVRFYGVAVMRQPIFIVLEMVPGLDLLLFLTNNRGKINKVQRHCFIAGVAFGIEYIHSQGIIHRDLAARNCLVDSEHNTVKISDFGMSIRANEFELTKQKKGSDVRLPLRWMAPECILELRYTQKSDVWAFGLIVYEIYMEGRSPYEGKKNDQVRDLLVKGVKPQLPRGAGKKLNDFMDNSVFAQAGKRATMTEICDFIVQWSGINRPEIDEEDEGPTRSGVTFPQAGPSTGPPPPHGGLASDKLVIDT